MTPLILTPVSCPATAPTDEYFDELYDGGARANRMAFDVPAFSRTKYPSDDYWNFARPRPTYWHPAVEISEDDLATHSAGWVYALFNEVGSLLYVGMTRKEVASRFAHHVHEAYSGIQMKQHWIPGTHHIVSIFSRDPGTTEVDWIVKFSPERNKEFRNIRSSETPSRLTDVLDYLDTDLGLPLRVDTAPPTRVSHTKLDGPMTREERVARAQEIRNDRIAYYVEWAQQPRKFDGDVIENPDGSVTVMANPSIAHWEEYMK